MRCHTNSMIGAQYFAHASFAISRTAYYKIKETNKFIDLMSDKSNRFAELLSVAHAHIQRSGSLNVCFASINKKKTVAFGKAIHHFLKAFITH